MEEERLRLCNDKGSSESEDRPKDSESPTADEEFSLDKLFILRKPRDTKNGLSHAGKNVALGIGAGIGSLFMQPYAGAKEEGAWGFTKGIFKGATSAVAVSAIGIGAGIYQLARGIGNESDAFSAERQGKVWDREKREWVDAMLESLEDLLEKAQSQYLADENEKRQKNQRDVVNTQYYDILQVPHDATSNEIKKAYYSKARQLHPDKAQDTEDSNEQFQALLQAYEVLSNPDTRKTYDATGEADLTSEFKLNELLWLLFGSDSLRPFTGDLNVLTIIENVFNVAKKDPDMSEDVSLSLLKGDAAAEEVRYLKIAIYLRDLIKPYVDYNAMARIAEKVRHKKSAAVIDAVYGSDNSIFEGEPTAAKIKLANWKSVVCRIRDEYGEKIIVGGDGVCVLPDEIRINWEDAIYKLKESMLGDKNTLTRIYMNRAIKSYRDTAAKHNANSTFLDYWSMAGVKNTLELVTDLLNIRSKMKKFGELEKKSAQIEKNNGDMTQINQEKAEAQLSLIHTALDVLCTLNQLDIYSASAEAVVRLCVSDTSVTQLERHMRASAMNALADILECEDEVKLDWEAHLASVGAPDLLSSQQPTTETK